MFDVLAAAVDELEIPPSCAAVREVGRVSSGLRARLTMALAELDRSGEWAQDGSATMAAWVRNALGVTHAEAARLLKAGRRLQGLPVTTAAWVAGELTDGQVDAVIATVTERRAELFAQHEAVLVPDLVGLDLLGTRIGLQAWAQVADAILDDDEPPEEPPAEAHLVQTLDGRAYLRGSFDAESHEVLATALRLAGSDDLEVPAGERMGQAMVDVARFYLDHQSDKLGKRHRPHLNVVVREADLARGAAGRTLNGTVLPGLVIRKIACDANIHRVITDGASSILDYGRATRTIPPAVYTSLVLRDLGCRFPGCDRPAEWCEGHHIRHWEDGGPTDLSNLVLLCSKHHHVIHQRAWHIKLRPDGAVEVTLPDGTTRTSDPPLLL